MAYCTTAQVTAQYTTAGTEEAANLAAWIIISDAEIDGVLRAAGYVTPIAGVAPALVTQWSILKTGLKTLKKVYEHQNKLVDEEYIGDEISGIIRAVRYIEEAIYSRKMKLKIARIKGPASSSGDSLTSPDVSQFKLPSGMALNTKDINE